MTSRETNQTTPISFVLIVFSVPSLGLLKINSFLKKTLDHDAKIFGKVSGLRTQAIGVPRVWY